MWNSFRPGFPGNAHWAVVALVSMLFTALTSLPGQANPEPADPAAEFVRLTAEIKMLEWGALGGAAGPRWESIPIQAVVGRNGWILENDLHSTNHYSYDGSRLVEQTWLGTGLSAGDLNGHASPGRWWTQAFESTDGNPGRTVREGDRLDLQSRIAWLAFCSSPALNHPGHRLYPPWSFWKEYVDPSTFVEKVIRFEDDLGLPKTMLLFSGERQPIVDYRVSGVTNVAGWLFPQSFFLLQYNPTGTKGWMLQLLAQGTLTSIAPATDPFAASEAKGEPQHQALRFVPVSPSKIHVEGTSDVLDWSLETTQVVGFLELNQPLFAPANPRTSHFQPDKLRAQAEFFLPVRHFNSGYSTPSFSDQSDRAVLHHALKTRDHPNIIYRLQQLTAANTDPSGGSALVFQSKGEVVIGGVTHPVSFPIQIARQGDGGLRLRGTASLNLSDYDIPPSVVEGKDWNVNLGDTVESSFDLELKRVE